MSKTVLALAASALLLAGCTSPPGAQESGIGIPALWSRLTGGGTPAPDQPLAAAPEAEVEQVWWSRFHDPALDQLVADALAGNQSLAIAKARVEEAEASRGLARAELLPNITANGSAQRGNQGYATGNRPVTVEEIDLKATWELDLFGRNQARAAQAAALVQSAEASRQGTRVALLAEVARTYFDLRDAERQIELTRRNLATQRRTLEIIQAQRQGAMASDFDVQRAGAQVSATEALVPTLETARDTARNRLAVLLGKTPGSLDSRLVQLPALAPLDPAVAIAAPAKVMAARPDIRAAERNFAASISAKDAATAELFPDISLSALFGRQIATPFNSTPWGLGLGLVQPILDFGRIESKIDAADAQSRQAFLVYQRTVLEGLEDMENALSRYGHEAVRNTSLTTGVAQNRKAAELARQQYANGYTGLLDVLVAERNLLDAEASQAGSDLGLRRDLVSVYTAAGGGWKDADTVAAKSP